MSVLLVPWAAEPGATTPAPDLAPLLEELATLRLEHAAPRLENGALRTESAVLQERVRELEARLGQTSANSSRPPASDPPQAPPRPKAPSSGRKRGGQPGHRGVHRTLLPVEQVDEIVPVVPEHCRHCQQPFREPARAPTRSGLADSGSGAAAPGGTRDRTPNDSAPLPDVWEAHPRGATGRGAAPTVRPPAGRRRSRGRAAVEVLLGSEFPGVVGSDRRSAYNRFAPEQRALCHAHLKRAFQGLVDRGGEAEPIGRWGLAEIERLFVLWHRFRAGEFDRRDFQRRAVVAGRRDLPAARAVAVGLPDGHGSGGTPGNCSAITAPAGQRD